MTLAQSFEGFHGSLSPSDSHSPPHPNTLFDLDDLPQEFDEKPPSAAVAPKKSNGRKGPGAADKRATHNAIERARRESLNGRFMTLAEALPSMAKVKRPSKSVIVQNALSFVYDAQVKEHALIRENNDLRRQVDQLRRQLGMAPLPPPAPLTGASTSSDDGLSAGMGALEATSPLNTQQQRVSPAPSFPSPQSCSEGQAGQAQGFAQTHHQQQQQAFGLFSNPDSGSGSGTSPTNSATALVGSPFSDQQHQFGSAPSTTSASESLLDLDRRHSFAASVPPAPLLHSPTPTPSHQFSPSSAHAHAQAQQQAQMMLLQAQAQQQQFNYLNPALLSQAHLIAAQMAQQQGGAGMGMGFGGAGGAVGQGMFEMYGMAQGAGGQAQAGWGFGNSGQQQGQGGQEGGGAGGGGFGPFV